MSNRTFTIRARVTPEEMQIINDRMEAVGINNVSTYLRKLVLTGYVIEMDMSDFKEILRLVHICSNNLNQYARRANETGSIYKTDIDDLKRSHEQILCLLGEILDKLGSMQ
ncbi:plasmid mobilization relaxosome protein MobC [Butyrivibrio sp. CB08]|uniref:plasmid mobilization protein n=1 Tax=Butyrivibrio sp. CB08 TaxID=2364879 RepID=UPI000EAA85A3|nr:plasmid mobilization relaxosome protein MobC [Butyrivibrio sp. CB08]RKM56781.1 plasmid mobilization relaxosome protein MobC [Butyrivibrio sp. CB08]